MKCIAIIGNPISGFTYIGPFDNQNDAGDYMNNLTLIEADWWVAPLQNEASNV